jgi:hypothetical protein
VGVEVNVAAGEGAHAANAAGRAGALTAVAVGGATIVHVPCRKFPPSTGKDHATMTIVPLAAASEPASVPQLTAGCAGWLESSVTALRSGRSVDMSKEAAPPSADGADRVATALIAIPVPVWMLWFASFCTASG